MDFYILFYIFLVALASGLVVSSRNPVQSVLFLVLVFFLTAIFFLCLGAEFLALIFLMVYIGAIATLFLFVVMMLNLRLVEAYGNFSNYHPLALFLFLSWLGLFSLLALPALPSYGFSLRGWENFLSLEGNLHLLGELFYIYYNHLFLLVGLLLFTAMLLVIVITMGHHQVRRKMLDPYGGSRLSFQEVLLVVNSKRR